MPVHSYSRCVVTLETTRSDVEEPPGSDVGSPQHRTPEAALGDRLAFAAARLEVLFDELEVAGRRFVSPGSPAFAAAPRQQVTHGEAECLTLELSSVPAFSTEALTALGARVASLIDSLGVTPLEVHSVADAPTRPEGVMSIPGRAAAPRRREDAVTRPQGVMAIRPPRKS